MMKTFPLPMDLPIWALVSLKITRSELRSMLGEPHYVETDGRRTCGGEQDAWAYELPSGQRVLVLLDATVGWAELCGDRPQHEPILQALGIAPDDVRLKYHQPIEMK